MFFAAVREVGLHGGRERVDVAVGMLTWEDVFAGGERVEVSVVLEESLGELMVARACPSFVGEIKVLGQGVGLVPGIGDVGVRALGHLGAVERLGREPREDGVSGFVEHGESVGIVREMMCVDEAAAGLIEGVGREAVAAIEAGDCGWSKAADEAMNLLLRCLVASYGIGAREAGEILPEGVTWDVAGHVFGRIEVGRRRVPAAHVLARRRLAGELAEGFEETVVVEVQIEIVLVMELL